MSEELPLTGWRRWLLDLSPIKDSHAFRILFGVRALSTILYGILSVAISWQVFQLSGSTMHVAYIGLFISVGMILGLIAGGTLADRWDRKLLMIAGRTMYMCVSFILLGNALLATPIMWVVYLAVFVSGLSAGISAPALLSVVPSVIPRTQLRAAGALNAISLQVGGLAGPLLAGVLIAWQGVIACYVVVALSAAAIPLLLTRLPSLPPPDTAIRSSWGDMPAGWLAAWAFVRTHRIIRTVFILDIVLAVFTVPLVLLPQIGTELLKGDAQLVSILYAAPAIGALCAALFSGWTKRMLSPWPLMIGAGLICALAMIGLGFADTAMLAIGCLVVFGCAKTVGDIVRMALLQDQIPAGLRGRVSSLWLIQGNLSPAAGGMQLGYLSQRWLLGNSLLISGAVACAVLSCIGGYTRRLSVNPEQDSPQVH